LKSTEIGTNFACFWPLKIFWEGTLKILDRYYKIERIFEHRAKFRADLSTELGDYAREKKKETTAKYKPAPQAIAYGRTNKYDVLHFTLDILTNAVLLNSM